MAEASGSEIHPLGSRSAGSPDRGDKHAHCLARTVVGATRSLGEAHGHHTCTDACSLVEVTVNSVPSAVRTQSAMRSSSARRCCVRMLVFLLPDPDNPRSACSWQRRASGSAARNEPPGPSTDQAPEVLDPTFDHDHVHAARHASPHSFSVKIRARPSGTPCSTVAALPPAGTVVMPTWSGFSRWRCVTGASVLSAVVDRRHLVE